MRAIHDDHHALNAKKEEMIEATKREMFAAKEHNHDLQEKLKRANTEKEALYQQMDILKAVFDELNLRKIKPLERDNGILKRKNRRMKEELFALKQSQKKKELHSHQRNGGRVKNQESVQSILLNILAIIEWEQRGTASKNC